VSDWVLVENMQDPQGICASLPLNAADQQPTSGKADKADDASPFETFFPVLSRRVSRVSLSAVV
jgi:hypothetical protein